MARITPREILSKLKPDVVLPKLVKEITVFPEIFANATICITLTEILQKQSSGGVL